MFYVYFESIDLADNINDDIDKYKKCCQTENIVLGEKCCQTDLDMAELGRHTCNISLMSSAVQKNNFYRLS